MAPAPPPRPRPRPRALRLALLALALLAGGAPGPVASSSGSSGSCSGRCGGEGARSPGSSRRCSCRPSCLGLGTCCPDYAASCPDLWPPSGTLLGGRHFALLGLALHGPAAAAADVRCRFAGSVETEGSVAEDGGVRCVSPLLYQLGPVPLEVSADGGRTFPWTAAWTAVHHNKVPPSEKSTLVNETKWQYYGTPGTQGNLTLAWQPRALPAPRINVELWGYRETGEPYSRGWTGEWRFLYSLARDRPNSGAFSFLPAPSALHGAWELGALRISSSRASEGQSNVAAIWSTEHALAWHLAGGFRQDSAAWATAKCLQWDAQETGLPNFLEELADCPCTLAQARADTGRFQADYGCDIAQGSVCTYHPGAVHCVRGVQASPRFAAGQQCCYDATGTQVLTGDSIGGSTPDRGHDWGAPPYQKPPRVPGFSHWVYDVLSFYYCCLWSQNCPIYFKHRPSSGCRRYRPPRAASAFGDPHLITFDSTNFTFKGLGEYTLLESSLTLLRVQGRTRPARIPDGAEAKVTGFSAIAMQENSSDVVEIRIREHSEQLEVLLNQKPLNYSEQTWMDLKGLFLSAIPREKVTVMFSSGAGAEVSSRPGWVLSVTLLLPEEFLNRTQGLFGRMNGDPRDDLAFRNGTTLDASRSSPEQLLAFGADWAIRNESSLFTYDTQDLLATFFYGPKHNSSFVPEFSPVEDPADPLVPEMAVLCQSDPFCRFDVLTTRDLAVGNGTRLSHLSYRNLKESLQPVVSCGWVAPPTNGLKNGTNYLAGSTVHFCCDPGFHLAGSTTRTCQDNGSWSGLPASCLLNAGTRWVPGPFAPCIALGFLSLAVALGTTA